MSVATCPVCGAAFLASVSECANCGVPLVRPVAPEAEIEPAEAEVVDDVEEEDGDADVVVFTLDAWASEQRAALDVVLRAEGVAHHWVGAELIVGFREADRVEVLVDELDHPDALDVEEDGDDRAAEILSILYVAADVLGADPRSTSAAAEVIEVAPEVGDAAPYGIDAATWGEVARRAESLAAAVASAADDDDVVVAARSLRELVRSLV